MMQQAGVRVLCILRIRQYHWSMEEDEGVMIFCQSSSEITRELANQMAKKRYDSWRMLRYLPETLTPNF